MRSPSPQRSPDSTRARGGAAERRAAWHYRWRGYRILETNAWAGGYELDVVARRGRTIVFCEVKHKVDDRFGDPFEMIDSEKQRRIRQAAETWLARRPQYQGLAVRFDAVAVRERGLERLADAF
jgi:putative endonuclease